MSNVVLLDTQIVIWAITGKPLTPKTVRILQDTPDLFISSISIIEIRMKQTVNRLPQFDIRQAIDQLDVTVLDHNANQAVHYQIFNPDNRDPFDNIIIASAISERMKLLTSDKLILTSAIVGLQTIDARK